VPIEYKSNNIYNLLTNVHENDKIKDLTEAITMIPRGKDQKGHQ